jgi:hypothetical protein
MLHACMQKLMRWRESEKISTLALHLKKAQLPATASSRRSLTGHGDAGNILQLQQAGWPRTGKYVKSHSPLSLLRNRVYIS